MSDCFFTVFAARGRYRLRLTDSADVLSKQELNLGNMVSAILVHLPSKVFRLTYAILVTPIHSVNDSTVFYYFITASFHSSLPG